MKKLLFIFILSTLSPIAVFSESHPFQGRYTGTALLGVEDPHRWVINVELEPFAKQYRIVGSFYLRGSDSKKTLKGKVQGFFDPSSNSVWGYLKGKKRVAITGAYDCAKKRLILEMYGIQIPVKKKGGAPIKPGKPCTKISTPTPTPTATVGVPIAFHITGVGKPGSIALNGARQEAIIYYVGRPDPAFPISATITFTGCSTWVFSDCNTRTMQFDSKPADRKLHFTNALGCSSSTLDHDFRIDFEVVLRDSAGQRTATWTDSFQCVVP